MNSITPNASPEGTLGTITRYECRRYLNRYLTFEVTYLRYYSTVLQCAVRYILEGRRQRLAGHAAESRQRLAVGMKYAE